MWRWLKDWWADLCWCLGGPEFLPADHGDRRAIDPPPSDGYRAARETVNPRPPQGGSGGVRYKGRVVEEFAPWQSKDSPYVSVPASNDPPYAVDHKRDGTKPSRRAKKTDIMPPLTGTGCAEPIILNEEPERDGVNGWGPFSLPYQDASRDERRSGNVTKPPPIRKATASYKNWREADESERDMIAGRIGQWAGEPDANLPKGG